MVWLAKPIYAMHNTVILDHHELFINIDYGYLGSLPQCVTLYYIQMTIEIHIKTSPIKMITLNTFGNIQVIWVKNVSNKGEWSWLRWKNVLILHKISVKRKISTSLTPQPRSFPHYHLGDYQKGDSQLITQFPFACSLFLP
jgi:hypothetical protein